ncbi:MAG: N-acetyl-gamma-glutamyl-phosphate reductase [Polyangia bacterium]|jgi:N-acetyl-gamma-glutamyl-phosphate reductase
MSSTPVEILPKRAGIVGVSGYSGMELARILASHPYLSLGLVTSDKWTGKRLGDRLAVAGPAADLICFSHEQGQARLGELDVVFLCTPAEVSVELAPRVVAAGVRVVDLSGGFRLAADQFPQWYGFTHPAPALLAEAVYSLPEATNKAEKLRTARLVSNPGCYATAAVLTVLPLLRAGFMEADSVIIDAKSGTTGAGRKASEEMSFSEVADDVHAYRIFRHQHAPEIEMALALSGTPNLRVTFMPHLLPVRRGILATAYGRLRHGTGGSDPAGGVRKALDDFAEERPFVHVVNPDEVRLQAAVGTNRVVLGASADARLGMVVSFAAIDNLLKGAAGQAVQNANLMFGFPETAGLLRLAGAMP